MLTMLDAICIAGSRRDQNDDAFGFTSRRAFVVDGATDLIETPFSDEGSDASWLARQAAIGLSMSDGELDTRKVVREIAAAVARDWRAKIGTTNIPLWSYPSATMLVVTEIDRSIEIVRLGDCSAYVSNSESIRVFANKSKADEGHSVRRVGARAGRKLDFDQNRQIELLRNRRTESVAAAHVFGLNPNCASNAIVDVVPIDSPTYVLAMTDGFGAMVDVYGQYTGASIIEAALNKGLARLAEELRAVEVADQFGVEFPRWKTSDDATAILLRVDQAPA